MPFLYVQMAMLGLAVFGALTAVLARRGQHTGSQSSRAGKQRGPPAGCGIGRTHRS